MFIDFVTLLLINLVATLLLWAIYMAFLFEKDPKRLIPGFLLTGLIGLVAGFHMIFNWPLPGPYNVAYGDMSVLYGGMFFAAGIALAFGWDLIGIGVYAFIAGAAAVLLGIRILNLGLTSEPLLAAAGFVLTGLSAMVTLPALFFKQAKVLRWILALILLASAAIWALTGYAAYWSHMQSFAKWVPLTQR
jgi:putative membrane protein